MCSKVVDQNVKTLRKAVEFELSDMMQFLLNRTGHEELDASSLPKRDMDGNVDRVSNNDAAVPLMLELMNMGINLLDNNSRVSKKKEIKNE